jgi:pectate lyase
VAALSACDSAESDGSDQMDYVPFGGAPSGGVPSNSGGIITSAGTGAAGFIGTGGIVPSGGSSASSGGSSGSGAATGTGTGGDFGAGGDFGSGGMTGAGGDVSAGGDNGSGGDLGTGGSTETGGTTGTGGAVATGGATGTGGSTGSCTTPPPPSPLIGWASVEDGGTRTTGGEGGPTTTVTTLAELTAAVKGTNAQVIQIRGTISGDITIGSNKTLVGLCGAAFHGHISMNRSVNVIIRNLVIVGKNCADTSGDCQSGDDTITVQGSAHHLWFDHDDISDGTDGNLDITHASDFITISWTKFHYSGRRSGGHQFSNLIGHSDDNAAEDTGHLRITFHHTWWADNAVERMPRVRFGRVHVFNSLWTASGNGYCIGVGNDSNIRSENNVFIGVQNPIKDYRTNNVGLIRSSGNDYSRASGTTDDIGSGTVFTPGYSTSLDPTSSVEAAVRAGAGPN